MKIYKTSKRWLTSVAAVSLLAITMSSCLKDRNTTIVAPAALVSFTQASPDEPAIDVSFDNNMVNLNPLGFGDHLDYVKAYTGKRTINVVNHSSGAKILSDTTSFKENVPYSLFLANTTASPQLLILTDSISNPGAQQAAVRFINLSPDAPAVDFSIKSGSLLATNKSFKGYTSFITAAGNQTYTIQVYKTGTSTVLATLSNVSLSSGFVYTIYLRGLASATSGTDVLSVGVIINAVYY